MPESTIEEKKLRVVAVDDSRPMLDMIVKLLTPHFEVVGIATDGNAAEELIKLLKPDIAILDISMPFKSGIDVAADLKKSGLDVKVVIVTAQYNDFSQRAAFTAGATAYVSKLRLADELVIAVESVYSGREFISIPRFSF